MYVLGTLNIMKKLLKIFSLKLKAGSQYDAGITEHCERHRRKHFFTSQILFLKSNFLTF